MKSTRWSVQRDPDMWIDDPNPSPYGAVQEHIEGEEDEAWEDVQALRRNGLVDVVVHGWTETSEPLAPEDQFDGYDPGRSYFLTTGETIVVRVGVSYSLVEARP